MSDVEAVKSATDIVSLIGQSVSLKKKGDKYVGLCPFHSDKRPSFDVSATLNRYRCWACGASGDCFNWVMHTNKCEFADALQLLATQAGIELKQHSQDGTTKDARRALEVAQEYFQEQFKRSLTAKAYANARGIDMEQAIVWNVGFAPAKGLIDRLREHKISDQVAERYSLIKKNDRGKYEFFRERLTFPIYDHLGRLIGFNARTIDNATPKYLHTSANALFNKSRVLYGASVTKPIIQKLGFAVLLEGNMDVISLFKAGIKNCVASMGTALTAEQGHTLKLFTDKVVIAYDDDVAGRKASARAAQILDKCDLEVLVLEGLDGQDPDEFVARHGASAFLALCERAKDGLLFQVDQLNNSDRNFLNLAGQILQQSSKPTHQLQVARTIANRDPSTSEATLRVLTNAIGSNKTSYAQHQEPKQLAMTGAEKVIFKTLTDPFMLDDVLAFLESAIFPSHVARELQKELVSKHKETPINDMKEVSLSLAANEALMMIFADDLVIGDEESFEEAKSRIQAASGWS